MSQQDQAEDAAIGGAQQLKQSLQYFQQELLKIDQELQTVKTQTIKSQLPLPWKDLNSTADAMVYLF